ncbi:MAG: hypothetical protein LH481_17035 [Burkholderiales bacterium]|nr:hypothetical protein [Burkholderiales bacterium]
MKLIREASLASTRRCGAAAFNEKAVPVQLVEQDIGFGDVTRGDDETSVKFRWPAARV